MNKRKNKHMIKLWLTENEIYSLKEIFKTKKIGSYHEAIIDILNETNERGDILW